MAYFGTTSPSSQANPPRQLIAPFANNPAIVGTTEFLTTQGSTAAYANAPGGVGGGLWFYASTNATTDMTASNFFVDAFYLGMRAGDMVMGVQFSSAGSTATSFLGVLSAVTTAGAALSTGGTMTSTFN